MEGVMIQDPLIELAPPPQNVEEHEGLIILLENLGNLKSKYPAELLTARRKAFIAQVDHYLQSVKPVIQHTHK